MAHPRTERGKSFPVVGIGASAAEAESLTTLLKFLPVRSGMAFVLIPHDDRPKKNTLQNILIDATRISFSEPRGRVSIEPDHIYIIPPNKIMILENGSLISSRQPAGLMPIDRFFHSLAQEREEKAIGIVLSGTASDGDIGLSAIRAAGGITFVQDRASKLQGNIVDFVLTPEKIARELAGISRHPFVATLGQKDDEEFSLESKTGLNAIFHLLLAQTGTDFSLYRRGFVESRVKRRIVLVKREKLRDYIHLLKKSDAELKTLYEDLLTPVSGFFGDPDAVEILKNRAFPKLIKTRSKGTPIRVWAPQCSTGEEAYSIAILPSEEILSSNEELQSANEEMPTSQEELRASNEELSTVNNELQSRNVELTQLGNDLNNLLTSIEIPMLIVGIDMRLRLFTPKAGKIFKLRAADVGRTIGEIRSTLDVSDLEPSISEVIESLKPREWEVRDRDGVWYSLRIRPYRTAASNIEGAVLTLLDVDRIKRSLEQERKAKDLAEAIVETAREPLLVLDGGLRVMIANRSFYEAFQLTPGTGEGRHIYALGDGQWCDARLLGMLRRVLQENEPIQNFEIDRDFGAPGRRILLLSSRRIDLRDEQILFLSVQDVTTQRSAERRLINSHRILQEDLSHTLSSLRETEAGLRQSREDLRDLAARLLTTQEEERKRVSRELHDDLNQKLAMLEVEADRLSQKPGATAEMRNELQSLRGRVEQVSNDVRRVAYRLHPSILDHIGLAAALRSHCSEFSKSTGIDVKLTFSNQPPEMPEDIALCLYRVTQEGLRNVAKHSGAKHATVRIEQKGDRIYLSIRDSGSGFNPDLPKKSSGIGLLSMNERVRLVNGSFATFSQPGAGVRVEIWVPLPKGNL